MSTARHKLHNAALGGSAGVPEPVRQAQAQAQAQVQQQAQAHTLALEMAADAPAASAPMDTLHDPSDGWGRVLVFGAAAGASVIACVANLGTAAHDNGPGSSFAVRIAGQTRRMLSVVPVEDGGPATLYGALL